MHHFPAYTLEKVLWEISWPNLLMLLASIPEYDFNDDGEDNKDDIVEELNNMEEFSNLANFINNQVK